MMVTTEDDSEAAYPQSVASLHTDDLMAGSERRAPAPVPSLDGGWASNFGADAAMAASPPLAGPDRPDGLFGGAPSSPDLNIDDFLRDLVEPADPPAAAVGGNCVFGEPGVESSFKRGKRVKRAALVA